MVSPWVWLLRRARAGPEAAGAFSRNAVWALAGASVARALSLVVAIVLARLLGGVGYGELSAVQATVWMFGSFASFGLGLTATKFVAEFRRSNPNRAGQVIGLSTVTSAVIALAVSAALFLLGPILARGALGAEGLGGMIRVASLLVFFGAVNGAQTGALVGLDAFSAMTRVTVIASLVSLATTVAGAVGAGLEGAIWGMVFGLATNVVLSAQAVQAEARRLGIVVTVAGCHREWRLLTAFSLPTALAEVMVGPITWVCATMLLNQRGGYAQFGLYSAVMRVKLLPEFLLGSLMLPLLPALTARLGGENQAGYGRTLGLAHAVAFAVMVPFAFLVALVPETALLPFGHDFLGHEAVVRWLMFQAVLVGLFQPMGSVLASINRMWFSLGYNLSWAAAFVCLSLFLVPRWLGTGLAAAFALSHLVTSIPAFMVVRRMCRPAMAGLTGGWLAVTTVPLFAACAMSRLLLGAGTAWAVGGLSFAASIGLGFLITRRALGRQFA